MAKKPPPRRPGRADPLGRTIEALHLMRDGRSLTAAAQRARTTLRTVRKYAGQALSQLEGRYVADPTDRLRRVMRVLTPRGLEAVPIQRSGTASRLAQYWAAVDRYLKTGDANRLLRFRGRSFRAQKRTYPFLTDLPLVERLAAVGEVRFEDLYEHST